MAVSFTDILSYSTETGMVIPQTSDIKQNIQNAMFEIFGSGFDTTEETTNGRLIEALTILTKNAIGVTAQNINYLNLNAVSGKQLDDYATFFGITRLPATKSRVVIEVDSNTRNYHLPSGTILVDKSGNRYKIVSYRGDVLAGSTTIVNDIVDGVYCMVQDSNSYIGYGYAEAEETGPIFPQGEGADNMGGQEDQYIELSLLSSDSKIKSIYVINAGVSSTGDTLPTGMSVLGREEESDFYLRKRIKEARDFGASSTMAIANAIWKAYPELRTVRVISNDSSSETVISGVKLYPHSILVCVSGLLSLTDTIITDSVRQEIALNIYKTKAAGVAYTDPRPNADINSYVWDTTGAVVGTFETGLTVNSSENPGANSFRKNIIDIKDVSTGIDHKVVFYEAKAKSFFIDCSVSINGYTGNSIKDDIIKVINTYVGGKINTLTTNELSLIITASIPGVFIQNMSFYIYSFDSSNESADRLDLSAITPSALEVLIPKSIEIKIV